MVDASLVIQATLIGLQVGMTLVLVSVGLTLIFGMMDVVNFAHGSLYMLGGYIGVSAMDAIGNFWLALLVVPLVVGLIGLVTEMVLIRPIYSRGPIFHILLTFGVFFVIRGLVTEIWGGDLLNIPAPALVDGSITIGPVVYPRFRLFQLLVSLAIVLLIWLSFRRTSLGSLMIASAHDPEMVDALGFKVSRIYTGVFAVGSMLAGMAGFLAGAQSSVNLGMDVDIIIVAFAIVIIGGLGSFRGAVIGGLLVGLVQSYSALFAPPYVAQMSIFLLMAIVLILKPEGLFGAEEVGA
jgi:branched-chain amino acid transport system permease protein